MQPLSSADLRLKGLLRKLWSAYRETGVVGLLRRSTRVSLAGLRSTLVGVEQRLYYAEARARLSPQERAEAQRAKAELSGLFRGRTVFILGTGPSLNQLDLSKLEGVCSIGVNSFYRHPVLSQWNPTLYCLMDGFFFEEGRDTEGFFGEIVGSTPRSRYVVTNCDLHSVCQVRGLLPYDRTFYLPTDGDLGTIRERNFDFGGLLPSALNSLAFAVLVALLAEAQKIVIVGADHDWLARTNREQQLTDPHFSGGPESFAPALDTQADWNNMSCYYATINYCASIWRCYYTLRDMAARRGARILNATPGSYLDVFESVNFDWAVENL